MRSHAIPMRLLKQFAGKDTSTQSLRMWRYERGFRPVRRASPKSETRTDGYFARPSNPSFEEGIEKALADQIENEVHRELDFLCSRFFVFGERHKRSLTRYIALLFMRCPGRKEGVRAHMEETRRRLALLFENEEAFLRYTMKVSIKEGVPVSVEAFRRAWSKLLATPATVESLQEQFAASLERWTTYFDDHLYHGQWSILHSEPGDPFIIGDNPVVTWRLDAAGPSFGVGLHQPRAEVFLPICPTACLHVLPAGHPRPVVSRPTPTQINEVEAMFMTRRVYSQTLLPYVDELVQRKGGTLKIGYNCFLPTRDDEADLARMLNTI